MGSHLHKNNDMTLGGWLGGGLFLFLFLLLLSFGLYTRGANRQCLKSHNWSFSRTQGVHSIWSVVLRPKKASWDAKVCKRYTTILTLREMACFTRIPSLQDQSMMNWKKTWNCNYKLHGVSSNRFLMEFWQQCHPHSIPDCFRFWLHIWTEIGTDTEPSNVGNGLGKTNQIKRLLIAPKNNHVIYISYIFWFLSRDFLMSVYKNENLGTDI